jgi:hypothetical protein
MVVLAAAGAPELSPAVCRTSARDGGDYRVGLASFWLGGHVRWTHTAFRAAATSRGEIVVPQAEQIRCPRSSRAFTRRTVLPL